MMMDCPRCGFNQPEDRYCANCGLDIEHFKAKPQPLFTRLMQNSTFHLGLIVLLIAVVVGYIFYSRRELVSREMNHLLKGAPLSSREAADEGAPPPRAPLTPAPEPIAKPEAAPPKPEVPVPPPPAAPVAATALQPTAPTSEKPAEIQKIEVSSWEMPRETLSGLITTAEKVGESNGGRGYLWSQGAKVIESVQSSGRRLSLSRTLPPQAGSATTIEAQMPPNEPFQFGIYLQVSKADTHEAMLKWDSSLVMPNANQVTEVVLNGNASLKPGAALLLVIEPPTRMIREELLNKAGDGPWSVLSSPDFRAGTSDWVMLVQIH